MSERRLSPEVIAGILEDYRAGMSTQEVAENRGVSTSTVSRTVRSAGATQSRRKERVWGPCEVCGKRCRGYVTLRCRLHTKKSDEPVALTGGEWVPAGGIMKWVPAEPVATAPKPRFDPNKVACHCGATVTQPCRTKSGGFVTAHSGRLARRCECGGRLKQRHSVCEDCARANELKAKRAYNRRSAA